MSLTGDKNWRESFFKENFNVDQCLSKYTAKSDLESIKNNLKNYGHDLHQQMADILKTETEAIVNLAEYLTNLNSKIDDLSLPINQLREEIKTLVDLIQTAERGCIDILKSIETNSNKQDNLILKFALINSAIYIEHILSTNEEDLVKSSIILERIVTKFSFEYCYLNSISSDNCLNEIDNICRKLTGIINKIFLSSIENGDDDVILRCLRMYENLQQQREAENLCRNNIVKPVLQKIFTEYYLELCNHDLNKIYEETLELMDSKLGNVLNILENNNELKTFNFVLNCFWIEIDKQSSAGLPYVTTPGNPELFQKRYKQTWDFLMKISEKCGNRKLIKTNQTFQNYLKRFNLPVYFEIRFQQIAGQFENDAILKPDKCYIDRHGDNDINCRLKLTLTLWKCLNNCFSPNVFIDSLADQFLKLSMLLLARYLKWFEISLKESNNFNENLWEEFVINSINDIIIIKHLISVNINQIGDTIYEIIPNKFHRYLLKIFELNSKYINETVDKLQKHLIHLKCNNSIVHLQNVASIPRLYRRTNRTSPKDPSNYVVEAVQPVIKFYETFKSVITNEMEFIIDPIISTITKQYLNLVQDVLRSVHKTEESLRRLKSRNTVNIDENATPQTTETVSDEMKIRLQIKLDVNYFVDKLSPLVLEETKMLMEKLIEQSV